jgi:hypothetical protein
MPSPDVEALIKSLPNLPPVQPSDLVDRRLGLCFRLYDKAGYAIINHFGKPRNTTALWRLVRDDK